MISSSYKQLRDRTLEFCEKFVELRDGLPEQLRDNFKPETLFSRRKIVKDGKFLLMVVGEAKSGKSTFINAYLGTDILPMEERQCTSAIIEISHAETSQLVFHKANGEIGSYSDRGRIRRFLIEHAAMKNEYRNIPVPTLNQLIIQRQGKPVPSIDEVCDQLKGDNIYGISDDEYRKAIASYLAEMTPKWGEIIVRIEIKWPLPVKMQDVHIVDSPGVNALGQVGQATEDFICNANAVVFLKAMVGQAVESKSFDEFIKTKNGNRHKKSLFLLLSRASDCQGVAAVEKLRSQAVDMYGQYVKEDMIIPIDSVVKLYQERFADETEEQVKEQILKESQDEVGNSWVQARWFAKTDFESFKQKLADKANFDAVQAKFEEYARSAQWIALKELIEVLVKGLKQTIGKLKSEIGLKRDQIKCTPEELEQKINDLQEKLKTLNLQVSETIDSIEDDYTGQEGKIARKKKEIIDGVRQSLENVTNFVKLETDIAAITDPLKQYTKQIRVGLVDDCNKQLSVRLGENELADIWADILEPDVDASDVKTAVESAKNDDSVYDTVTTGVTFKSSSRLINNDRFVAKVRENILQRLDDLSVKMQNEVITMAQGIVAEYKSGLNKRIRDEGEHLESKKQEKVEIDQLKGDISKLEDSLAEREKVLAELNDIANKVENGINRC